MSRSVVLRTCRAYLRPHSDCPPSQELPPAGTRRLVVARSQIPDHRAPARMCDRCDSRRAPGGLACWMRDRRLPTGDVATSAVVLHGAEHAINPSFPGCGHTNHAAVSSPEGDSQSRRLAHADISSFSGGQADGPQIATRRGDSGVSPAVPSAVSSGVLPEIGAEDAFALRTGPLWRWRGLRHLYALW
jgi:hypothetical protein